jgi:hypothetical protein
VSASGIVELRRYALHPGTRETLIELFERELVETQEACGLRVLGTFRDVDDPSSFVWLRGFADMATRGESLRAFYAGPVWAEHRDAANATMIDSDNVLLLRPLDVASRLDLEDAVRPRAGAPTAGRGVASLTICPLDPAHTDASAGPVRRRSSGRSATLERPFGRGLSPSTARTTSRRCRYARARNSSFGCRCFATTGLATSTPSAAA